MRDFRPDISVEAETDPQTWNSLIERFNGHFVQSYEWSECMIRNTDKERGFLVLKKKGEPAAAGWYAITGRKVGPVNVNRELEMESLPCYDPLAITPDEIIREVLALAGREKIVRVSYGNSSEAYAPAVAGYGPVSEKISFVLELAQPVPVLFSNLKDSVRRKLRKADSGDIRIARLAAGEGSELFDALPPMFEHTIAKHIEHGKRRHRGETGFFLDTVKQLVTADAATLFVGLKNRKPLSCALISTYNRNATYLFGASAPEGYRLNAAYRVIWSAVEYLKDAGYRRFSLGEVHARARHENDRDHGLYRFKKEFGGTSTTLVSGGIITRPFQYGLLNAIKRLRNTLRSRESTV